MERAVNEFIQGLDAQSTAEEFRGYYQRHIAKHGFHSYTYLSLDLVRANLQDGIVLRRPPLYQTTTPPDWEQHYQDFDYASRDPIVFECFRGCLPVLWDQLRRKRNLTAPEAEVMAGAEDFGFCNGYTIPVHGAGGELGIVSLYAKDTSGSFREHLQTKLHLLHLTALHYHSAARKTLVEDDPSPPPIVLTSREVECLLWTSQGKTAWEIAQVIGVKERTVVFHLSNAMRKLGVHTKSHAVAKMMVLGIAHP